MTIEQFRYELLKSIFGGEENIQYKELTDEDWAGIHALSAERYANWDWNYGKSPKFNMQHSHRFPVGGIDVRLDVNKGIIEDVNIFGDFFGVGEVAVIEESLTGVQYDRQSMSEALDRYRYPDVSWWYYERRVFAVDLLMNRGSLTTCQASFLLD